MAFLCQAFKTTKINLQLQVPKKNHAALCVGFTGGRYIPHRLGPPLLYAWFLYSKINMGKKQRLNGGSGGRHVIKDDHKEGEV